MKTKHQSKQELPYHGPDGLPLNLIWSKGNFRGWHPLPARHTDIEFQYVRHGAVSYFVDKTIYMIEAKGLLVIRPGESHILIPGERFATKCCLLFAPAFAGLVRPADWFGLSRQIHMTETEAAHVELILNSLEEERCSRQPFREPMLREQLRLLVFWIRRIGQRPQPVPTPSPIIAALTHHLEQIYRNQVKLKDLARVFGFSPDYLSRLFKEHAGIGIKRYILWRRINEAKQLLQRIPHVKVTSIAADVGFESAADFHRAFRLLTGLTPVAWRGISHSDVGN